MNYLKICKKLQYISYLFSLQFFLAQHTHEHYQYCLSTKFYKAVARSNSVCTDDHCTFKQILSTLEIVFSL